MYGEKSFLKTFRGLRVQDIEECCVCKLTTDNTCKRCLKTLCSNHDIKDCKASIDINGYRIRNR